MSPRPKTQIEIHPKYTALTDFICAVPSENHIPEAVLQNARNLTVKTTVNGIELTIKKYKVPHLFNRIVYSRLRMSKAERSYRYAQRLAEMGIGTPEPIAFVKIRKGSFFHTGYFVSVFLPYPSLIRAAVEAPEARKEILLEFASFTADLHRRGIVHHDYNAGNVLGSDRPGPGRFSLIDINRLRFRRPSRKTCIRELSTLKLPLEELLLVVTRYAELRGWNPYITAGKVLRSIGRDRKGRLKRAGKRLLVFFR